MDTNTTVPENPTEETPEKRSFPKPNWKKIGQYSAAALAGAAAVIVLTPRKREENDSETSDEETPDDQ